ncbi:MAG: hypothetical protein HC810_00950 [Acaryochloridaceae cyanobacterium RL_2_7]|nr:hypothetical protein [Acaryochloridaceae cyanobacterium RL_2_7]
MATITNEKRPKVRCLVISRRIGLTRIGYYQGGLSPQEITNEGQCKTLEWDQQ